MKSLDIQGRIRTEGFPTKRGRHLVRLAEPRCCPASEADAAIIRSCSDLDSAVLVGFKAVVILGSEVENRGRAERVVYFDAVNAWLGAGDVVAVEPDTGRYRVLWRQNSRHNTFLVTDRCDHYCLMCSQPPKNVDDDWIIDEIYDCLVLLPPTASYVGFTGGEPFLQWRRFIPVVHATQAALPDAAVHVLSNGRAFARTEVVDAWSAVNQRRACLGIPIYSAVDAMHDYVVQSRGAFDETVLGILRLKDKGNRVEVRVVLNRLTVERLPETCEWLARNLPFLDHIALMGMEDTGFALANHELLWIDPLDYRAKLAGGVLTLAAGGLRVSIYNLPLCVLPEVIRPYAVQSISDWKNAHPEICASCAAKERCAGFFTTGHTKFSRGLSPILAA